MEVPIPRYFKEDSISIHRQRDRTISGYMSMKLGVERVPVETEVFMESRTIEMTYEQGEEEEIEKREKNTTTIVNSI